MSALKWRCDAREVTLHRSRFYSAAYFSARSCVIFDRLVFCLLAVKLILKFTLILGYLNRALNNWAKDSKLNTCHRIFSTFSLIFYSLVVSIPLKMPILCRANQTLTKKKEPSVCGRRKRYENYYRMSVPQTNPARAYLHHTCL